MRHGKKRAANVAVGSLADIEARLFDVRPLQSGHQSRQHRHPMSTPMRRHLLGLLRSHIERPNSGRYRNRFDEIASSHCLPEAKDRVCSFDYSRDL